LNSLGRSAIWVAGSVLGQFLVGFGFALLLNGRWPGNRIMRALILMPWVMPGVSIAIGWSMIYNLCCYGAARCLSRQYQTCKRTSAE
jgi:ABC-type sugar transport system permease subunit